MVRLPVGYVDDFRMLGIFPDGRAGVATASGFLALLVGDASDIS